MATRKKAAQAVETTVGTAGSGIEFGAMVALGTTGDVVAAPVLETLTGGASADGSDAIAHLATVMGIDMGEGDRSAELVVTLTDKAILRTAHDAIEALLGCARRLRVLDRLEPETHALATGALADLKARLGL